MVGRTDAYCVELVASDELSVVAVQVSNAVPLPQSAQPGLFQASKRHGLPVRQPQVALEVLLASPAQADDAHAQRFYRWSFRSQIASSLTAFVCSTPAAPC